MDIILVKTTVNHLRMLHHMLDASQKLPASQGGGISSREDQGIK